MASFRLPSKLTKFRSSTAEMIRRIEIAVSTGALRVLGFIGRRAPLRAGDRLSLQGGAAWIVAPAPRHPGNYGDELMVAAAAQLLADAGCEKLVVVSDQRVFTSEWEGLPTLRFLSPPRRVPTVLWVLTSAALVAFRSKPRICLWIGADTVDGAYGRNGPYNACLVLALVRVFGTMPGVIGYSVRDDVPATCWGPFLKVPGLRMVARDRQSANQARDAGLWSAHSLDLALFVTQGSASAQPPPKPVLVYVLNSIMASGEFGADGPAWIDAALAEIDDGTTRLVLVGHDLRGDPDDWDLCSEAAEALNWRGEVVVPKVMSNTELRQLFARSSAVIATRMHAGLSAINVGTPALVFSYFGKHKRVLGEIGLDDWAFSSLDSPTHVRGWWDSVLNGEARSSVGMLRPQDFEDPLAKLLEGSP